MLIDKINNYDISEPVIKEIIEKIKAKSLMLINASASNQIIIFEEINNLRNHYLTIYWISYIGYLKDITSTKYLESEAIIGKLDGYYNNAIYKLYEILTSLPKKDELLNIYGERFFQIANNTKRLQSNQPELFFEEKRLRQEYRSIINKPKINFQGELMSLIKLSKYLQDEDESIRKNAFDKRYAVLTELNSNLVPVFNKLLNVRKKIAISANFNNYFDYSFIKMNRIGYTKADLKAFKAAVLKHFVPINEKLKKAQAIRLGERELSYYNSTILFKDGNAKTSLELNDILDVFSDILESLSPDFSTLFIKMRTNNLIDLEDRENKSGGGITTLLPDFKCPIFIKSYAADPKSFITLAHEFGHSFQLFANKDKILHENRWPTFDIAEIHSTTMELLVSTKIEKIYKNDTKKFLINHYTNLLNLIIKMSLIDDFQTKIYSAENIDINLEYKKLYQQYYPSNNYNLDYYKKGVMWQEDINRIDDPFYGIDYALAIIYAFSYFKNYLQNPKKTIREFIDLCKLGGEISFKEIGIKYHLANPFDENSLKELADFLNKKIEEILK